MTKLIRGRAARLLCVCLAFCLMAALVAGCSTASGGMKDGYYTAEMADYDEYGWKEYLILYISAGRIVTVEYNAKNASGFIKSWDMDYMRVMNETDGTYPNEYTRAYAEMLLNRQDPERVDAITGATHSYETFQLLAAAAIDQAMKGDESIAYVAPPARE